MTRTGKLAPYAASVGAVLCVTMVMGSASAAETLVLPPKVGAYYFTGWTGPERWTPIYEFGDREPAIGWYRDDLPTVQDWHIRQATQHGISFWVFDWYYDHRTDTILGNNAALDKGFLNASLRSTMDFALLWCNEEKREPDFTESQLLRLVRTIGTRYLSQANYLRTSDGRNILGFTRPDRLITQFGADGTRAALQAMCAEAEPWGGLFFIGIKTPTTAELTELKQAGFDACTLYSYEKHGMAADQKEAPYSSILPVVEPLWASAAEERVLPVIPLVSPGWDSRPWYGDEAVWRKDNSPEMFGLMCDRLKAYVDPGLNLLLVGTWNEFGEGSHIEPTLSRGCSHLDAMQRAFFPDQVRHHQMSIPSAEERARLDFTEIPNSAELVSPAGGNRIINPGFERDFGWATWDGSPVAYATDIVHGGKRALVVSKKQGGVKTIGQIKRASDGTYQASVWVYGRLEVTAALFGADGQWLTSYQPIVAGGQAGAWTELTADIKIDNDDVWFFDVEVKPLDETVWVDDVDVERK